MMRYVKLVFLALSVSLCGFSQEADALFNSAENLFANGNYQEAEKLYTQVIEADAENMNAYLRRGFCRSVLTKYEAAVADYSFVIENHSKHPFAYLSRGSAYNKMEKWQDALIDFNMVLNIDPKNQEAYNNRGWTKNGMGLYKEACKDWKASKKLGNEEAKIILKNNQCK